MRRGSPRRVPAARAATAVTSPALALRLPRSSRTGTRSGRGRPGPLPRNVTSSQGRTAYPTSNGQWPISRRSTTKGLHTAIVTATSRAGTERSATRAAAPVPAPTSAPTSTTFCRRTAGTTPSRTATTASEGTARGNALPSPSVSLRRSSCGTHTMS